MTLSVLVLLNLFYKLVNKNVSFTANMSDILPAFGICVVRRLYGVHRNACCSSCWWRSVGRSL